MAACRSAIERRRSGCVWRSFLERKFSTALSQEARSGWSERSNADGTTARRALGMFARGIAVEDDVDQLSGRQLALTALRNRMNSQYLYRALMHRRNSADAHRADVRDGRDLGLVPFWLASRASPEFGRSFAHAVADVVAMDNQGIAMIVGAADDQMDVRIVGVPVINPDPIQPRSGVELVVFEHSASETRPICGYGRRTAPRRADGTASNTCAGLESSDRALGAVPSSILRSGLHICGRPVVARLFSSSPRTTRRSSGKTRRGYRGMSQRSVFDNKARRSFRSIHIEAQPNSGVGEEA
jgi:hypothetical protein